MGTERGQPLQFPPWLSDWLPADRLARSTLDAVDQLDLTDLRNTYRADGRGGAAHEPSIMVALLLYAY